MFDSPRIPDPRPVPVPEGPEWMRDLPGANVRVSALCAGGGPLGSMPENFGYSVDRKRGIDTVLAVLTSSIRTIDTANGYSDGESERRIGAALAAYGGLPNDVVITTKVDPKDGDYSAARVRASIAESRERLGIDQLPVVYLHDPEFHRFEDLASAGGAVQALADLRDSGEIGAIGLAGGDVHECRRYLDLGVFDVLLVHNRWTLVDRSAGSLIADAVGRGMGVVNAAVYGGGILAQSTFGTRSYGYRPAPKPVLNAVTAMRDVCAEAGTNLATAAVQFSLRDPRIATTVVGFSRPSRVRAALDACRVNLDDAFWERMEQLLPDPRYWLDAR